jgi:hypothetical protein
MLWTQQFERSKKEKGKWKMEAGSAWWSLQG